MPSIIEPDSIANEGWFNNRWRPAMAWLWFTVSGFDFIIFPILNGLAAGAKMIPYAPWEPITLRGGGLFHVAMGAVVGVAVWQRSQEKLALYEDQSQQDAREDKDKHEDKSARAD